MDLALRNQWIGRAAMADGSFQPLDSILVPGDLQQVQYQDSRLRGALAVTADPAALSPELQQLLTCTKAKAWAYEEELRRFIDLRSAASEPPRHFVPFDEDMRLAEVILGERCTEDLIATRELLAKKCPSAVAFKARLAYRSFRVVLNGYTRPSGSPQ